MAMVTVDTALYHQAREVAAAQGKTVEVFLDEALRQALARVGVRRAVRNGLPVMIVSAETPALILPPCARVWRRRAGDCVA